MKKVLITGMSGLVGGVLRDHLQSRFELSALNRRNVPGVPCHTANIGDLDAIQPAFEGIDAVVHMAAFARSGETWDAILNDNIIGTYNVFEASLRAGVKRIVFASSGMVVAGWESVMPFKALAEGRYEEAPETWEKLTHQSPVWPRDLYGCSKVFGEALGRHYADTTNLSILCLRMGNVVQEDRPSKPRQYAIYCSKVDIARIVECCLDAPVNLKYDIFYALSNNRWGYRDLEHAREVIGYVPASAAEDYRE